MLPLVLLALACGPTDEPDDTNAPALAAEATLEDDIPTVAWVRWETDDPGTSWVEYGPTKDLGRTTVPGTVASTAHAVLLAGMSPRSTWYWRAVTEIDGERHKSQMMSLETGVAPRELPEVENTSYDASLALPGYTITTSLGSNAWLIVFDTEGNPVWWKAADEGTVFAQVRLSPDGTSILYNVASLNFGTDVGEIRRIRLDGEQLSATRTVMGHHDFVGLPEGGFAYIAADTREWVNPDDGETYTVVGDTLMEVPEGATDDSGNRAVWSTWDDLTVAVSPTEDDDFYPFGLDWTHSNSLKFDEDTGTYVMSVRKEDAVAQIDRASGDLLWTLGGVASDFTRAEGRAFVGQHSPEFIAADRFMLFDNGDINAPDAYSEAVEYSVDLDARTYTPVWHYDLGQRISSYLLGDVERLANGNTLIAWGSGGTITEVTPDGETAFQVSLSIGAAIGFTHHIDALGGVETP